MLKKLTLFAFSVGMAMTGIAQTDSTALNGGTVDQATIDSLGLVNPEVLKKYNAGVAAFKGETDISIGNLIGSNIFNIMAVIGITAMITPIGVSDDTIYKDFWWVMGIALALLPIMFIGKRIGRFKGALLLSTYIVYITLAVMYLGPAVSGQ